METLADLETASDGYSQRFSGDHGKWFLEVQQKSLLQLLSLVRDLPGPAACKVLDVGGGHGQVAAPLAERGYDVTVIGSCQEADRQVKQLTLAGKCRWQSGDLLNLPYEDRSFEVVTCFRLLPHCDKWQRLIQELCRVSKRAVILDYPPLLSFNLLYPLLFSLKKRIEGDTRTFMNFANVEVQGEFERAGFRAGGRVGQFFLPMVVHRVLRSRTLSAGIENLFGSLKLRDKFGSPVVAMFERG